jgi:ribosomal protein S18 acetylase RimI-like enzyme
MSTRSMPQPPLRLARLDLHDPAVADQVLALLREAHDEEAARWAVTVAGELPFGHTLDDLVAAHAAGREVFHGACWGDGPDAPMIGCVSVAAAVDGDLASGGTSPLGIGNLCVRASRRRRGVARALLASLIDGAPGRAWIVVTGQDNGPALALYSGLGFVPVRTGALGPLALPVVQLVRPADAGPLDVSTRCST